MTLALLSVFHISGGTSKIKWSFCIINHNLVFRCVELLIAYDANINHAADGGQTPLYLACKNGNKECIKLLLEAGTDRSVKTRVSTSLVCCFVLFCFGGGRQGGGCFIIYSVSTNSTARKIKYAKIEVALLCFAFRMLDKDSVFSESLKALFNQTFTSEPPFIHL